MGSKARRDGHPVDAHGVRAWISRTTLAFVDALRPVQDESPHDAYQARFVVGTALIGMLAAATCQGATWAAGDHDRVSLGLSIGFVVAGAASIAAVRLGARVPVVAAIGLVALAFFVLAKTLTTSHLRTEQLYWFVLLPGVAVAMGRPRGAESGWPLAVASLAAVAGGSLSIAAHSLGFTFSERVVELPLWVRAIDHAVFSTAVCGLMLLYDVSARAAGAELRQFRRLLSVCTCCKKVHDRGVWVPIEIYFAEHHAEENVYGLCPACSRNVHPSAANELGNNRIA